MSVSANYSALAQCLSFMKQFPPKHPFLSNLTILNLTIPHILQTKKPSSLPHLIPQEREGVPHAIGREINYLEGMELLLPAPLERLLPAPLELLLLAPLEHLLPAPLERLTPAPLESLLLAPLDICSKPRRNI